MMLKRIVNWSLLNHLFAVFTKGIEGVKNILLTVLVARSTDTEFFGIFTASIALVSIVAIVAEFRLQSVLVKYSIHKYDTFNSYQDSAIVTNLVFAIVGFSIIAIYSMSLINPTEINGLLILAIGYFIKVPRSIRSLVIASEKYWKLALAELGGMSAMTVLVIAIIYYDLSPVWFFYAKLVDYMVINFFYLLLYLHNKNAPFNPSMRRMYELVARSFPLVLSGVAIIALQKIDVLFVKEFLGYQAAGLYSAATLVVLLFSLLPITIAESLAPRLFKDSDLNYALNYMSLINLIGLIMMVFLFLVGPSITVFLYGNEYKAVEHIVKILSLSPLALSLGSASAQIMIRDSKQSIAYIRSIIGLIVSVVLQVILIPKYGIEGAAIGSIFGLFTANFFAHILLSKYRYIFYIQLKTLLPLKLIKL